MGPVYKKIFDYNLGKRESPNLKQHAANLQLERSYHSESLKIPGALKLAFIMCKFVQGMSTLPGWTGFNIKLSSEPHSTSKIGYLPVVDAPVTEMSTIYTILCRSIDIVKKLNLPYGVIVCDEAVYAKMQLVRRKTPELLNRLCIRLGDLHACMSFMSAIGKRFESSGLKVVLSFIYY